MLHRATVHPPNSPSASTLSDKTAHAAHDPANPRGPTSSSLSSNVRAPKLHPSRFPIPALMPSPPPSRRASPLPVAARSTSALRAPKLHPASASAPPPFVPPSHDPRPPCPVPLLRIVVL
ncbi:hypothetical protein DFH07DRAFT_968317 [Mycena maculata]|uniref:Uncharacterized protein n=1 Tax=Mycena maculata TaxID=230809 RepID=A0AAD7I188_9AGAR|nr:hypothetical protein DFH07DRAFT_968317 [Mycena maculata]